MVSATALVSTQSKTVRVRVQTELGDIVIEVDPVKAPITAANFLNYVDAGHYDGGIFHRTVKMDNQPESTVKIEVIQAGVNPGQGEGGFPGDRSRANQRDRLLHKDGVMSMARGAPDSATSGWFVCINDQPSLDFGGQRNPDGQGFARVWTRRVGHGRRPQDPGGALIDHSHDQHRGPTADAADQDPQGGSRALDAGHRMAVEHRMLPMFATRTLEFDRIVDAVTELALTPLGAASLVGARARDRSEDRRRRTSSDQRDGQVPRAPSAVSVARG